jgi:hypothetical protein
VPDPTPPPANPEARARAYAEGTLGVDRVYDSANAALEAMGTAKDRALLASTKRRRLDSNIADREADLASDERASNAELSATAFEKHIKAVFHADEELRDLRAQRDSLVAEYERAEADAEIARMTARVEAARLEELGGLLHFYAAVKQSARQANDNMTTRTERLAT